MKSTVTPNRKTGRLIVKNLIILLVLIAVTVLSIWAWFTKGQRAEANGINIQSKASGIEVSWNGTDFYENLTALTEEEAEKDETGKTGLAKSLLTEEGEPAPLKLVTGNGLDFFEPLLNRRTGTVLSNNGVWQGVDVTDGTGKYIDVELYFRSRTERSIYLAGDSKIYPKNADDTSRWSEYGDFSKDYICAASRVAFLNSDLSKCNYIWAPNSNYELAEDENGYTKYTELKTEDIIISGGGSSDIDGGVENNGKAYYFWTFYDDAVVTSYPNNLSTFEARKFEYDSDVRYFVTEVTTYIPTYGGSNPSIPIFINETSSASQTAINNYNTYIDGSNSKNTIRDDLGQYFGVTNTNFNIGDYTCSNAMYIIDGKISAGAKITYKLGYDPVNKLLVILSYNVEGGGSFSLGDEKTDVIVTVDYYELENNASVVLANSDSAVAVSSNSDGKKSVRFKNSDKLNILPVSVTTNELFTVKKTGDGYEATYQFQNASNSKFLRFSDGEVSLSATGSYFTLAAIDGFDGPVLQCGDYYLIYNGRKFAAYTIESFDTNDLATVFTGSSYILYTDSSNTQTYKYYSSSEGEVTLSESSTPPLFETVSNGSETSIVGTEDTPVVKLTKENESDEYYKGKIVMRIWAEGTDRDALTPLADGIFDLSLHFTSK